MLQRIPKTMHNVIEYIILEQLNCSRLSYNQVKLGYITTVFESLYIIIVFTVDVHEFTATFPTLN